MARLALSGSSLVAGSVTGILTMIDVGERQEKWRYVHPQGEIDRDSGLPPTTNRSTRRTWEGGWSRSARAMAARSWEIGGFSDGFQLGAGGCRTPDLRGGVTNRSVRAAAVTRARRTDRYGRRRLAVRGASAAWHRDG